MRLAIISDIHGNLPALEAVLAEIDASAPDEVWCLGDVVGYGAEPNECAELVTRALHGVPGRATTTSPSWRRSTSRRSRRPPPRRPSGRSRSSTTAAREFLAGLHAADESREVALYHASPRDHVWEYVLWPEQAGECIAKQAKRVALIGHSHIALCFRGADDGDVDATEGAQVSAGTKLDIGDGSWLLNPGSVGQPRDGDPRAAWLELDTEEWTATYRRTEYEVERAAESIAAAGLPEHLGKRLFVGQ